MRSFTFGHVRQLDAVASRFLVGLAQQTPVVVGIDGHTVVDVDDTINEVHGHAKQGAGLGSSGARATLFDTWRFHAFFTTSTLDTVTADKDPPR